MQREIRLIFPDVPKNEVPNLLIIPVYQPSTVDLVSYGSHAEDEKDRLLKNFTKWANEIIQRIKAKGFWADATDPCSGMPMHSSRGPATFDDVSAHSRLLLYDVHTVGGASGIPCKVISHPKWGSNTYPSSLFTIAPFTIVKECLNIVN
eukprot:Phypoly_transcript_21784.p1 GENE.Phypoly_transcript_21784~~Phypoly_transcript_21784.p1  ORF type:complete len:149 (+),score=6.28 Phypoly_transcript_21784:156-602(+)